MSYEISIQHKRSFNSKTPFTIKVLLRAAFILIICLGVGSYLFLAKPAYADQVMSTTNTTGESQETEDQPKTYNETQDDNADGERNTPKGCWYHDGMGWWYRNPTGTYPWSCWQLIDNMWYHFDSRGYAEQNCWSRINGVWYGFNADCSMTKGWTQGWNGTWYYCAPEAGTHNGSSGWNYPEGCMIWSDWAKINGNWYYFDQNGGARRDCWSWINGVWYGFNADCSMTKGWTQGWDGSRYYCVPQSGPNGSSSGWNYPEGCMVWSDWMNVNGAWYYLNSSGDAARAWRFLGDTWYWLDPETCAMASSGIHVCNGVPSLFNESGAWIGADGTYTIAGKLYTINGGIPYEVDGGGWQYINNNWYYVMEDGTLKKGWVGNDVTGYYFCSLVDGHMLSNMWIDDSGNNCNTTNAANRKYYLDATGKRTYTLTSKTPVLGAPSMSKDEFIKLFSNRIRPSYPSEYSDPKYHVGGPEDFSQILWDQAIAEEVDPVVMAAMIALETGWVGFKGSAVPASACNFGGIGAFDYDTTNYHIYPDVPTGLAAQAEYLRAYATTAAMKKEHPADPHAQKSPRGVAPYAECFGSGIYATDPAYPQKMITIMNLIRQG